jgi:hypothetical protein
MARLKEGPLIWGRAGRAISRMVGSTGLDDIARSPPIFPCQIGINNKNR